MSERYGSGWEREQQETIIVFHGPMPELGPKLVERSWTDVIQLVVLLLAFMVGMLADIGTVTRSGAWNVVFLSVGAMGLGIGAGVLMYRRWQENAAAALRADYADLGRRAEILGGEWERLRSRRKTQL